MVGVKRRSGCDSTLWRSSPSSSGEELSRSEPPSSTLRPTLKSLGARFPFGETLKGRLLGNGFDFDAKLCGFVSNWASVMGPAPRRRPSSGELTHTPGWAIYLIRCSNERDAVYPRLKRSLVWLRYWKRPQRRGRRGRHTGMSYKSRAS